MLQKYVTGAIGAVGANTNQAAVNLATNGDDNKVRRVTGVKSSLTTKGMTVQLFNNGQPQVQIDAAALGQLTDFADVDFTIATNITIQFSVNNQTGGALSAGDYVTVRYEVPS